MKWFKFYGQDWLTDLKIRKMRLEDRLCFITLLCLASSSDGSGVIKNCDEESLIDMTGLHDDPYNDDNEYRRAVGCLERYRALQIVTLDDNGDVTLVNFNRRQGENLSNAERQQNYRERLKTKTKQRNGSNVTQRNDSNARIDKNRIEKNIGVTRKKASFNPLGNEIIKAFEEVDPKNKTYYGNTTQRGACDFLLNEYGMEKVLQAIKILPQINQKKLYVKQITSPWELKENWVKLGNALKQQKSDTKNQVAFL